MANLNIVDTGYPNTSASGTQADAADRTNSGKRLNLFSVEVDYNRGANTDDSPNPGQFTDSKLNPS